jgi:elongation factor Ts
MEVSASLVKMLREKTGAGVMDCKQALADCEGNFEKAIDALRRKGLAAAAKKAGRIAAEGNIGAYIHAGGKIGVLVELNCETDFVARTPEFQSLVKDLAMQIAAASPRYIRPEDVPPAELEREKEIYRRQALDSGKPEKVVDKIVEGKTARFYAEVCLLEQAFIKDPDRRVGDLIKDAVARLGENIQVRRFTRYHLGEEILDP